MSYRSFDFTVGSKGISVGLPFYALSVQVDNPTNQWLALGNSFFIAQMTVGAVYPLGGTDAAVFSFTAPPGATQPPTIAGQSATITYYDLAIAPSAGVGLLGGRAPYYDRNPLTITKDLRANSAAGDGSVSLWTYTVPTGRKAYLETFTLLVQIRVLFASDDAELGTSLRYVSGSPGVAVAIGEASIYNGTLVGTIATLSIGASVEFQSGESLQAYRDDARSLGAGSAVHRASAKLTEFDG